MNKHLIIIGGVAAGAKTAAKARRQNNNLKITLYTQEEHISYSGCGLPYYIGDDVKDKTQLLLVTPEEFKVKRNVDVHLEHKVTKINPDKKEITILDINNNKEFTDNYDYLMIGTGASPFIPPIEGVNLNNIFTLRNVPDAVKIKEPINEGKVKNAVIVGGGLIGMECAEALVNRGVNTTVIELLDQILGPIDQDMAKIVEEHCKEKGLNIITSDGVKKFVGDSEGKVCKVITNQQELDADLVIMSIGVRPNIQLAIDAGIEIGESKAIKVNKKMQTNIPDIYSAGDCVESTHIISQKPIWMPLGSIANKQARVAAINITGGNDEFQGVLGSLMVKVFDLNIGKSGLSEKECQTLGYDYVATKIKGNDKAGYYPGSKSLTIKMIADKKTHKLLGCQVVGEGAADKRIDAFAMALTAGFTAEDLEQIDLGYAPPYSMAIDVLLVTASSLIKKLNKEKALV